MGNVATGTNQPFGRLDLEPLGGGRFRFADDVAGDVTEVVINAAGPWWTLTAPAPAPAPTNAPPIDWLARPGLWKLQSDAVQVCDLPAAALQIDGGQSGAADAGELFDWLLRTRAGEATVAPIPEGFELAPQDLTASNGPFTCQGAWHPRSVGDHQSFVDFPLATLPDALSGPRTAWLHAMRSAARDLRLVRVALDAATRIVHARVDVTGCPPRFLTGLVPHATACLRLAVARLLPAITVLTDVSVVSRALELDALAETLTTKP